MFVYFWFMDTIISSFSSFNWISWIAPMSINVAAITGSWTGLGLNPWPTFDWNWQLNDPIVTPLFSILNQFVGACIAVPIIAGIWYSNTFNTAYFPINSNHVFDNTGAHYNVSLILTPAGLFNETAYEAYSPAYLGAGNAVVYLFFFALYTSTITYSFLYHRHEIAKGFRSVFAGKGNTQRDIHSRLMAAYPEVPDWWYAGLTVIAIGFGLAGLLAFPTGASVSSLFFGLALTAILVIPIGIVTSVANTEVTLNVIAEFVGGAAFPGNYVSMVYFKTFGVITASQAVTFAQDLKLGHYMKIPPRLMFWAQTIATILAAILQVFVIRFQLGLEDICLADQPQKFICPGVNTFFTAAVLWGTIGPKKIFAPGQIYNPLLWGFFAGAFLPLPFYFYVRKFPRSWLRYVHVPAMIFGALLYGSPFNLSYFWLTLYIALFFNFFVRRRYLAWWSKYAYVLTTSFSAAIAISAIIQFPIGNANLSINWWGNLQTTETLDFSGAGVLKTVPPGGHF
jgi:OPT family small oligopeptide transporter